MADPNQIEPSIDAGSDSLARFRYQAEVTLPFCLQCALGDEIVSVIPEHLEDIAVEYEGCWRFIQVKSRNPERGLWKLSDLLGKGGALRSLFRTHLQTLDVTASLEILLEGTPKPRDLIENLREGKDHRKPELVSAVVDALEKDAHEVMKFLDRVILLKPPVPRPNIKDNDLRLIHQQNKSLDHFTVCKIYDQLIAEIERAMRAERVGEEWPHYVIHPENTTSEVTEKIEAKRLTKPYLQKQVAPITSPPRHLLRRITDSSAKAISNLERKLISGGATKEIIKEARKLRANAQLRWMDVRARSLFAQDDLLEDLRQRLETHAVTKRALHTSSPKPAIAIWDALLTQFSASPRVIDPDSLMNADPMLLLGEVCELSELCRVTWGLSDAD